MSFEDYTGGGREGWKRQEPYQITRNVCVVASYILLIQIRKGVLVSGQGGCS
ncbi:hypothetical protein [Lacrimispora sp.]|uniref:hypothetical protein n=1 Tax=Lacrimispora sp. TaxID=2719234 RepID=UPI0028AD27E1|nr:hypothetical protein [Lacrimispora sp.]